MTYKKILGDWGEELACKYLHNNSYKIVERNYRCAQGEIDIIAQDLKTNEVVFIEVKTRRNFNYGMPCESVNNVKKAHILSAIKYYMYTQKLERSFIRIDVIEIVENNGRYKLNHLKNLFI